MTVPYDELDPPVVTLVRALNAFPGIETVSSCAGHDDPDAYRSADEWTVAFHLTPVNPDSSVLVPTVEALVSLEFIAWVAYDTARECRHFVLEPIAKPPWLNFPGHMLHFRIEGFRGTDGIEPAELAAHLDEMRDRFYVPAQEIEKEA